MGPKLTPGAILTEIPRFVIDQAMGALKSTLGFGQKAPPDQQSIPLPDPNAPQTPQQQAYLQRMNANMPRNRQEPWFGPGVPLNGNAPRGDVAGRASDYPVAVNLSLTPRQYESMNFGMIRGLFEGLDVAKLCVETRKNQMAKLSWEIMPRMRPGQNVRQKDDPRCAQLEAFFRSPDRKHNWDTWMRMLLHEMLVIDAPAIYVRRTVGGDIFSLEVIDGATLIPRYDKLGRTPAPPETAYTQILKGIPAINYTSDEIIYFPRNLRAGKLYGQGAVELIGMTIQIAIRREINKLAFWTEGNIPDALIGVPEKWTPEDINRMQLLFDNWTSDQQNRRKAYFIPGGTSFNPTRPVQTLDPQQDEWLARVITFAFNLPNLPLVNQQNRATAETANDAALREGLAPNIVWLKGLMDHIFAHVFGFPDLEFVMDNYREDDPDKLAQRQLAEVKAGALSIDEYRAERGLPSLGMGPAIFGIGPLGVMFVDDLLKAKAQGLTMPQPPPPPDAGMMGAGAPYDPQPALPGSDPAPLPGQQQIIAPPARLALPMPHNPPAKPGLMSPQAIARLKSAPAVSEIANHHLATLPPQLLDAVGLKADHAKINRPVPRNPKRGAAPALVLAELARHEAKFKGKSSSSPPPG
jgi:hypothetical protein